MDSGYTAQKTGRLDKQWQREEGNKWNGGNANKDQSGQMQECNTEGRRNWSTQTRSWTENGNASSTKRNLRGKWAILKDALQRSKEKAKEEKDGPSGFGASGRIRKFGSKWQKEDRAAKGERR